MQGIAAALPIKMTEQTASSVRLRQGFGGRAASLLPWGRRGGRSKGAGSAAGPAAAMTECRAALKSLDTGASNRCRLWTCGCGWGSLAQAEEADAALVREFVNGLVAPGRSVKLEPTGLVENWRVQLVTGQVTMALEPHEGDAEDRGVEGDVIEIAGEVAVLGLENDAVEAVGQGSAVGQGRGGQVVDVERDSGGAVGGGVPDADVSVVPADGARVGEVEPAVGLVVGVGGRRVENLGLIVGGFVAGDLRSGSTDGKLGGGKVEVNPTEVIGGVVGVARRNPIGERGEILVLGCGIGIGLGATGSKKSPIQRDIVGKKYLSD